MTQLLSLKNQIASFIFLSWIKDALTLTEYDILYFSLSNLGWMMLRKDYNIRTPGRKCLSSSIEGLATSSVIDMLFYYCPVTYHTDLWWVKVFTCMWPWVAYFTVPTCLNMRCYVLDLFFIEATFVHMNFLLILKRHLVTNPMNLSCSQFKNRKFFDIGWLSTYYFSKKIFFKCEWHLFSKKIVLFNIWMK